MKQLHRRLIGRDDSALGIDAQDALFQGVEHGRRLQKHAAELLGRIAEENAAQHPVKPSAEHIAGQREHKGDEQEENDDLAQGADCAGEQHTGDDVANQRAVIVKDGIKRPALIAEIAMARTQVGRCVPEERLLDAAGHRCADPLMPDVIQAGTVQIEDADDIQIREAADDGVHLLDKLLVGVMPEDDFVHLGLRGEQGGGVGQVGVHHADILLQAEIQRGDQREENRQKLHADDQLLQLLFQAA